MNRETALIWTALGAAVLWALSRTRSGTQAIQKIASGTTGAGAWLMSQIRGIRNNNPGNIRRTSDVWEGMALVQSDPDFVDFTDPRYGIRAMTRILRNYYASGATTLTQMIERWAPREDNDTDAYIADVSAQSGIGTTDPIDDFDTSVQLIIPAMIQHENGIQPYPADLIAQGIQMEQSA